MAVALMAGLLRSERGSEGEVSTLRLRVARAQQQVNPLASCDREKRALITLECETHITYSLRSKAVNAAAFWGGTRPHLCDARH